MHGGPICVCQLDVDSTRPSGPNSDSHNNKSVRTVTDAFPNTWRRRRQKVVVVCRQIRLFPLICSHPDLYIAGKLATSAIQCCNNLDVSCSRPRATSWPVPARISGKSSPQEELACPHWRGPRQCVVRNAKLCETFRTACVDAPKRANCAKLVPHRQTGRNYLPLICRLAVTARPFGSPQLSAPANTKRKVDGRPICIM